MSCDRDPSISKAYLVSLSQNSPLSSITQSDGVKLITMLLHDQFAQNHSSNQSGGSNQVATFEHEESIESLEKQEIVFKLITRILDKVKVDFKLHDQVSSMAKRQLHSMPAFLKSRRGDWNDQDTVLKTRVNAKLFVYQAAAKMKIKSLMSLETDEKTSKRFVLETLTLLLDAADACLTSVWRKMKPCKELFSSLLSGVAKMAAANREQPSPCALFIRLKPLVLAVCAQPETWVRNQGNMFESIFKVSCEIIESAWAKDRASVETFIVGFTSSIRDRNDYEEQVEREKQVSALQLNIIQLLADITIAVKKPEVADMIFPFFIERLEEGDASTPSSLRLQLLDAVSRIATLGFEKSYRETVVLMTRSYLSIISRVGSVESKTPTLHSITEHIETLSVGFLTIASGLINTKLRADYRHRLLSLCSDVGLASESKSEM